MKKLLTTTAIALSLMAAVAPAHANNDDDMQEVMARQ
jgi:hypothetical protein